MSSVNQINKTNKQNWITRFSQNPLFILFIVGVGGATIWRFPSLIMQYGAVFFLPFVLSILFIGLPMLILKISFGRESNLSAINIWERLNKKFLFLGWIQIVIGLILCFLYIGIASWGFLAFFNSINPNHVKNGTFSINKLDPSISNSLHISWIPIVASFSILIISSLIGFFFFKKKIISYISVILTTIVVGILAFCLVYVFTLHGKFDSLNYFFSKSNFGWSELGKFPIWQASLSQALLVFLLGSSLFAALSKNMNKRSEINATTTISVISVILFSLFISIITILLVGDIASHSQTSIQTFYKNNKANLIDPFKFWFYSLPHLSNATSQWIVEMLLYIEIFVIAIFIASVLIYSVFRDLSFIKVKSYKFATLLSLLTISFLPVFFLGTNFYIYILNIINLWIANVLILISCLIEIIIIVYFMRKIKFFTSYANSYSAFRIGPMFEVLYTFIVPFALLLLFFGNINHIFTANVITFTLLDLYIFVLSTIAIMIISSIVYFIAFRKNKNSTIISTFIFLIVIPLILILVIVFYFFLIHINYKQPNDWIEYLVLVWILLFSMPFVLFGISIQMKNHQTKLLGKHERLK